MSEVAADGSSIEKKGLAPVVGIDGTGLRVGIVHTRWNAQVVDALVSGAERQLVSVAPRRGRAAVVVVEA
jgi:6,7-dimethyl-8-ribityllumazine synthase